EFFPRTQPNVSLTLRQPIFRGFREYAGLRQYRHLSAAQKQAYGRAFLDLHNEVAQSYYGVLAREQDLANLKAERELYQGRVGELRGRVRAGTSSETDLLSSEAADARIGAQLKEAESSLQGAREAFVFLTGYSRDVELALAEVKNPAPQSVESYLAGIEKRPDLLGAIERREAADEAVKVAWGGHLPSIDVLGNYYLKRPEGVFSEINWDVQATLTLPIYSGGIVSAQVTQAALQREQSELEITRLRRLADQEIRTLYAAYRSDLDSIYGLEKAVAFSEKNYTLLRRDYRRGLTRNLDVLQAQSSSLEARRALTLARFTAKNTWIRLQAASGNVQLEEPAAPEPAPARPAGETVK
ncbi:MAG TPA: TolC family protein, partial [Bdellovibrionota bacterium]|nr:TolC family protein [Bdellovibrionota bacterium]